MHGYENVHPGSGCCCAVNNERMLQVAVDLMRNGLRIILQASFSVCCIVFSAIVSITDVTTMQCALFYCLRLVIQTSADSRTTRT